MAWLWQPLGECLARSDVRENGTMPVKALKRPQDGRWGGVQYLRSNRRLAARQRLKKDTLRLSVVTG